MRRLSNVSQGGVPPRARVKQVLRQQAILAKREEAPVQHAVQGRRPREINAGRELRWRVLNVGVAMPQVQCVGQGLGHVGGNSVAIRVEC